MRRCAGRAVRDAVLATGLVARLNSGESLSEVRELAVGGETPLEKCC